MLSLVEMADLVALAKLSLFEDKKRWVEEEGEAKLSPTTIVSVKFPSYLGREAGTTGGD